MVGAQIGQYTIKQKLGEGGMGSVYLAEHRILKRAAAIKVLLPQWTANAEIVERFRNEAIAMGALEHPNIVNVSDCGQLPDGSWYIVMEYLEGRTLASFCAAHGGPLSTHLTLQVLAQVAAGLEAAHRHGIVHRDLKPENIMVLAKKTSRRFVKILDWGISKLGEQRSGLVTRTGMMAGTPAYMAPEQMRDLRTVDRRSDVFALGVIAYQMVTGGWLPLQKPGQSMEEFAGQTAAWLLHLLLTEEPIDPRHRVPTINDGWAAAILAALHRDPARRPQSARAFLLLLAEATPGDNFQPPGTELVRAHADELLDIGNLEETVRAGQRAPTGTRTVSRYRFGDQLGAGGMAEVFRATQLGAEGFARVVAVKRVLPGFSMVPQFASMFVQEAKLASLLDHPNIISVLDFDRDEEGRLFLAMEFVDGRDLASLAATGRLPFSTTIHIITETLRGLGYAHNLPIPDGPRGLVHRDVSPQNVLLSWEGAVKVSDFGIAKAREASAATASTLIKGKPQYMSPEQANGEPLDGRSDLFAVGIMLWELLTGRRLFDGGTHEVMARVAFGQVGSPSAVAPDIPPDLEAITMRLLARAREARYPTAEAAIEDLARCAHAPRNGPSELARVLAERFPDRAAFRASQPPASAASGAPSYAQVTANERPMPASPTTLGSLAGPRTVPPAERSRRPTALLAALGIGLAIPAGAVAFLALRGKGDEPAPRTAATPPPSSSDAGAAATGSADGAGALVPTDAVTNAAPDTATLIVTTEPTGAVVHIDGVERGPSPITIVGVPGQQIAIEVAHEGYESAKQMATLVPERTTHVVTLRPRPTATSADEERASTPSEPSGARRREHPKKPAQRPRAPAGVRTKPAVEPKFNPDDALGE